VEATECREHVPLTESAVEGCGSRFKLIRLPFDVHRISAGTWPVFTGIPELLLVPDIHIGTYQYLIHPFIFFSVSSDGISLFRF
jgi:hypothetical protein